MFLAHYNLSLQLLVATILLTGTISTLALVDHQNSTITTSTRSLDALPHRLYRRGGYIEQNENDQHAVDTNALARKISEAFESACYYGSACLFGPDSTVVPVQRTADGAFDLGLDESKIYRFKYGKSIDVTMLRTVFDNSPGFTLGPRLGAGSFGTVYRGATPHSDAAGSAVAFKFPLMKDVEMILSEVAVVNRLQHVYHNRPAVLDLLALPRDVFWVVTGKKQRQDQIIFALDYMTSDVLEYLMARNPSDLPFLQGMGVTMFRALRAMHGANIVHLDVKVENLLMHWIPGKSDMHFQLADFGFALHTDDLAAEYKSGRIRGTFGSMAPEIVFGQHFGKPADIYAAGVALFIAATKTNFVMEKTLDIQFLRWHMFKLFGPHVVPAHQRQRYIDMYDRRRGKTGKSWVRKNDEDTPATTSTESTTTDFPNRPQLTIRTNTVLREFLRRSIVEGEFVELSHAKRLQLVDLLLKIFTIEPEKRPTAAEVLKHRFFREMEVPDDDEEEEGRRLDLLDQGDWLASMDMDTDMASSSGASTARGQPSPASLRPTSARESAATNPRYDFASHRALPGRPRRQTRDQYNDEEHAHTPTLPIIPGRVKRRAQQLEAVRAAEEPYIRFDANEAFRARG